MNRVLQSRFSHILSHILVLVWMWVIYSFSAQNGETSGGLSGRICYSIVSAINDLFRFGWEEVSMQEIAQMMGFPIRKLAHMSEFGILALLNYWACSFYPKVKNKLYVFAFGLTVLYAATDEFHQLFIADRSGNLIDVGVDATGALLALVVVWFISRIAKKRTAQSKV